MQDVKLWANGRWWNLAACLALFALNLQIAWPLFVLELTGHFGSVEPVYYVIARGIQERWPDMGWWPMWNLGMPFEYTYQPLLHHVAAAVSSLSGWSTPRGYHVALTLFYCCGPVAVYALVRRMTQSAIHGFVVGLLYSVVAPSIWLVPDIAADAGGLWVARRLHTAIVWGDGPYVAGLTLVPLALLMIDRAVERRTAWSWVCAAIALASVPLTNIPAAISMTMALAAYALSFEWRTWAKRWTEILLIGAAAYALFCPWLPPSAFAVMIRNMRLLAPASATKFPFDALFIVSTVAVTILLQRVQMRRYARFVILFGLITAEVVLFNMWFHVALIGQAGRFHLVMEMALLMAAGWVFLRGRILPAAAIGMAILALVQMVYLRRYAEEIAAPPTDVASRSEYKVAEWMNANAAGERVFITDGAAFWFNQWTPLAQFAGCCDQNSIELIPFYAKYAIFTDDSIQDQAAVSIAWMKAFGIHYFNIAGDDSTDAYRGFRHPKKFEGVLPVRFRGAGETIYEVPLVSTSLAHYVSPDEVVRRVPKHGADMEPLTRYLAALDDASRSRAQFEWVGSREAVIRGNVPPGNLISVQVSYHPGWTASTKNGPATVSRDELGMVVVDPHCNGNCEVRLFFDGGVERKVLRVLSIATWLALIAWCGAAVLRR
jgi:hypothetical protein